MTLEWLWEDSGNTLEWFWGDSRKTVGWLWDDCGMTVWWLFDDCGMGRLKEDSRKTMQGCCAGNGKFQYYVNSVYFCQFQYFLRLFMSQNQYNITNLIALNDCITNFPELEFWVENLQKDWMARNEFASLLKKTSTVKLWYYLFKYWV